MFLAHIVQDIIKGASQYKGKVVTRYAVSPEWDGRDRHERTSDGSIFTRFELLKHQLVCFRNFKLKESVTLVLTKVRKVSFRAFRFLRPHFSTVLSYIARTDKFLSCFE